LSFKALKLTPKLLKTLERLEYHQPTPIQEKAIPLLLEQQDLIAIAQTGTGKTATFLLPMIENLPEPSESIQGKERYSVDALILAPTRELVLQIHQKIQTYAQAYTHQSVALHGGIGLGSQIKALRAGANIAVGTTSRVREHLKNGSLDLSKVKMVILDEADRMLEMGFIEEVRTIFRDLPQQRHTVMFSATFATPLKQLAHSLLHKPTIIEIPQSHQANQTIHQQVIQLPSSQEKLSLLLTLFDQTSWQQVLIFVNTKRQADRIAQALREHHIPARAIHGDKTQQMRTQALDAFTKQEIDVLVATDIAGRGIDIVGLPAVINFELPHEVESYLHRIGRTGRANQQGVALSLVSAEEYPLLNAIEKRINQKLNPHPLQSNYPIPPQKTTSSTPKREKKEHRLDLKEAKALAKKMMAKEKQGTKKRKKEGKGSRNKRHF